MLSHRTHARLDYATVAAFAVAPTALGLTGFGAGLSYLLAVVHLLMTLVTAAPLSLVRLVPNRIHGLVELAVAGVLTAGPWLTGDLLDLTGKLFFSLSGLLIFAIWLGSDYSETTGR